MTVNKKVIWIKCHWKMYMGPIWILQNKKHFCCQCCSEINCKMWFLNDLSKIIEPISKSTETGNHHQVVIWFTTYYNSSILHNRHVPFTVQCFCNWDINEFMGILYEIVLFFQKVILKCIANLKTNGIRVKGNLLIASTLTAYLINYMFYKNLKILN